MTRERSQHRQLPEIDPAIETQITNQAADNSIRLGSQRFSDLGRPFGKFAVEELPELPPFPARPLTFKTKAAFAATFVGSGVVAAYVTWNLIERFAGR